MYGSVRPNLDFPKLVDLYLEKRLKIDELVSRTYKLGEINEGFTALRTGQVARGVVVFN
jgi:S-(hydroxymethyl)glutathione dehydrogenase/alcohol dehydrogenase